MAWAKTRPEAFSEKTGKPDVRGAYGLLAREVIALLKHLQHAPGKTVIFVGVLERIVDEFNREHWQPQMEGGKAARELPAIVDQVITMSLFEPDGDGWRARAGQGPGAPPGLPLRQSLRPAGEGPLRPARRDRAARSRGAARQDQPDRPVRLSFVTRARGSSTFHMYDFSDVEPQQSTDLIPDGTSPR